MRFAHEGGLVRVVHDDIESRICGLIIEFGDFVAEGFLFALLF